MKPVQVVIKNPPTGSTSGSVLHETIRNQRHGREIVEFSVKGPIGVSINDEQLTNSGCAILDLVFAAPSLVGELSFRNYYTMWISVLVKTKLSAPVLENCSNMASLPLHIKHDKEEVISDWIISVPKKIMMQSPHHETGSQDIISIPSSESLTEWKNLVAMRIILRQPSPVWKTFHIEEINVYKDPPRRVPNKECPAETLMILIKKQTIAALNWSPANESLSQNFLGGYEFNSLPQP